MQPSPLRKPSKSSHSGQFLLSLSNCSEKVNAPHKSDHALAFKLNGIRHFVPHGNFLFAKLQSLYH